MSVADEGAEESFIWRKLAEEAFRKRFPTLGDASKLSLDQIHQLLHELSSRQIELEAENAELRHTQNTLPSEIRGRKSTEDALAQSERLMRCIVDCIPANIALLDLEGVVLLVNRAWKDFAERNGVSADNVSEGRNYLRVCESSLGNDSEGAAAFAEGIRAILSGTIQTFTMEYPCHSPGEKRWFIGRVSRLSGDGPPRALVFHQDITERWLAEKRLQSSEEGYRVIFEESFHGILAATVDARRFVYANPAICRMLGYSETELLQLGVENIHPKEALDHVKAEFESLVQGEKSVSGTVPCLRKDGSVFYAEVAFGCHKIGEQRYAVGFFMDVTAHRQVEEALKESNTMMEQRIVERTAAFELARDEAEREKIRLEAVMAALPIGVCISDNVEGTLSFNTAFEQLWRSQSPSFEVLTGSALKDVCWAGNTKVNAMDEWVLACAPRGCDPALSPLMEIKKWDGSRRSIIESFSHVHDSSGNVIGTIRVAQDITELQKAELSFRQEAARRQALMAQSRDGIVVLDQNGRVYESNKAFAEMLGYTMEEMGELHVWDWEAQMTRPELEEAIRRIDPAGDHFITKHRRKNGSTYDVEITSTAATWEEQKLILCMCRDITERLKAEEALRESERRYRMVADYTYDWEYWIRPDGTLLYVSPACERITGYFPKDFIENPGLMVSISHEDNKDWVSSHMKEISHPSSEACQKDFRIVTLNGEVRWISHYCRSIRAENGDYLGRRASNRDITDRVKTKEEKEEMETRLQNAQKIEALGTLAGGIAHDFNNILSPIIGYTEIALDDIPESSQVREDLKQVLVAANRATELAKQILAFSRQSEVYKKEPVDISRIVKEALTLLKATLPSSIEIRQSIKKATVMGNTTQFHQVVINLCTNAAHAMDGKGRLDISVAEVFLAFHEMSMFSASDLKPGKYARVIVKDTGTGMSEETMLRIFDPYFTTKEVGKGTGLGLAVVHGIVKKHGGEITVRSRLGQGSEFTVYLPAVTGAAAPAPASTDAPVKGSGHILIVDDEPEIAELGARVLRREGYTVTAKADPRDALELFRTSTQELDLVITDYTMPHMTGTDLAEEILKVRPDVKVILCTGFNEKLTVEMVKDLGISALFMKPLGRQQLLEAVRRVLEETVA